MQDIINRIYEIFPNSKVEILNFLTSDYIELNLTWYFCGDKCKYHICIEKLQLNDTEYINHLLAFIDTHLLNPSEIDLNKFRVM